MKISGWFRRNNTIMAQAKDLSRQLTESWDDNKKMGGGLTASNLYVTARWHEECERADSLTTQLHRVARERDQERKKRIDAEMALLDRYLVAKSEDPDVVRDRYLENAENEEE